MATPNDPFSTNDEPPEFGPTWPNYPRAEQLVRITGLAASGVYFAFVQQMSNPPATAVFRDREQVYATDPNGTNLLPGYYNATVRGAFNGPAGILPLLTVTCCPSGSSAGP